MRAVIQLLRRTGDSYSAKTDNGLLVAFRVTDGTTMNLGDELEIELPGVLQSLCVRRVADGKRVAVQLKRYDIHDLRAQGGHGTPSDVSDARMRGS